MAERSRRLAGGLLLVTMIATLEPSAPTPRSTAAMPSAETTPATEATRGQALSGAIANRPAGWRAVLAEDFSGDALDTRRWGWCHWWDQGDGCTIASNDELEWYLPKNVSVSDGRLRLEAREEEVVTPDDGTFPFSSGMISSGPRRYEGPARFGFTYGYVEARLRLPQGTGVWPAFWLLPADSESRPEIDIVETIGQVPDLARFHYHYRDARNRRQSLGDDWGNAKLADGGWHRYAVDWRPGRITWIVDGRARWRVSGAAVSSEPMYVVLNLAVGGVYPGDPDEDTEFPAAVEADWIRVWQPPRRS